MSDHCCQVTVTKETSRTLRRVLWAVLGINAVMFLVEMIAGYLYGSAALMADSLDMLGDAFVYGVSILVLVKSDRAKAQVSLLKGVVMTALALYVIFELVLKLSSPGVLDGQVITIIGFIALLANGVCFWLLSRYRQGDINMRSAWVCSRNDMVANGGVIVAGALVLFLGSPWPDIVVGALIAGLILTSSVKVIADAVKELKQHSTSSVK